jgi:hypothetical protein
MSSRPLRGSGAVSGAAFVPMAKADLSRSSPALHGLLARIGLLFAVLRLPGVGRRPKQALRRSPSARQGYREYGGMARATHAATEPRRSTISTAYLNCDGTGSILGVRAPKEYFSRLFFD